MAIFIKGEDYDLIVKTSKFRQRISKYLSVLELNRGLLETFNSENELFMHVYLNEGQYKTCSQSFIEIKIELLRTLFAELTQACKSSRKYTSGIGRELGIERLPEAMNTDSPVPEMVVEIQHKGNSAKPPLNRKQDPTETLREMRERLADQKSMGIRAR